jgi:hypothetical protein
MTMSGCFVDLGMRILAAVALLLAVMSSPIRPTRASHTVPPHNYLPRNFAPLAGWADNIGHCGQLAMWARPSWREADSLQSDIEGSLQSDIADELDADIEDELTVTSPPASVSFDVLPCPCSAHYSELVSFAVPLAARPLRC